MSSKGSKRKRSRSPTSSSVGGAARGDRSKGSSSSAVGGGGGNNSGNKLKPSGYLIACDVPTKQFIQHLNELKPVDKKFVIAELDSTHLLVKAKARQEIARKVEEWMDEVRWKSLVSHAPCQFWLTHTISNPNKQNVFSSVEKVGEDLDMS